MAIINQPPKEKYIRFSVVIPESMHIKLENYVRELAFTKGRGYSKSDFVREAIIESLHIVYADKTKTPSGSAYNPVKALKVEPNIRFSVVIGESHHEDLESFVREYSFFNHVDFKKSDFVRESVLARIAEIDAEKAKATQHG